MHRRRTDRLETDTEAAIRAIVTVIGLGLTTLVLLGVFLASYS